MQGPHRDVGPPVLAGFMPLRLNMEPGGLPLDVLAADVIVGRHSDAEVRLLLPDISRRHCRLVFDNQQWRVHDLNSLNGVFVNGERVQESSLYHGDKLQLGTCVLGVEYRKIGVRSEDLGVRSQENAEFLQSIAEAIKEQKRAS